VARYQNRCLIPDTVARQYRDVAAVDFAQKTGGAMDNELIVALEERKDGVFVPSESCEYFLERIRTVWFEVTSLSVSFHVAAKSGEARASVSGEARLDRDTLGVIGNNTNQTQTLKCSISPCDWPPKEESKGSPEELLIGLDEFCGYAEVGFSSSDWEIGNPDEWFISVYVPRASFDAMVRATLNGTANRITAGARFDGLYVHDKWAPPSIRVTWYLRPHKLRNDAQSPEFAFGKLRTFRWDRMPIALPSETESSPEAKARMPRIHDWGYRCVSAGIIVVYASLALAALKC
jgi:hypothetical protein